MRLQSQRCPICERNVTPYERYPRYLCDGCMLRVEDKDGRRLEFFNEDLAGYGVIGRFSDTQEPYESRVCYVAGIRCLTEEARFGGIVIQTDSGAANEKGPRPDQSTSNP